VGSGDPGRERIFKHFEESKKRAKKLTDILTKETARGCALVAGALLDERLLKLIQARMIARATANKFDSFFEGHGPLATFAARTHLAYLFGFIADNVYQDLCVIRGIRNQFAHSSEDIDFNDDKIKTDCAKLRHYMKRRVNDNPRAQFIFAAATLDTVLEYLIFDSKQATTPTDGPEEMGEILGKQSDLYAAKLAGIPPTDRQ
jgi:DNA-binding MltR family transcriptional regulator